MASGGVRGGRGFRLTGLAAAGVQDYAQNRAEVRTATAAECFVEEIDVVAFPDDKGRPVREIIRQLPSRRLSSSFPFISRTNVFL